MNEFISPGNIGIYASSAVTFVAVTFVSAIDLHEIHKIRSGSGGSYE